MPALAVLALAGAGAVGALLRYLVGVALPARRALPWGVLLVNLVGSFVAGIGLAAVDDPVLRLAIVTGFCGGLTTFSTHAVDTVRLALGEIGVDGAHGRAAAARWTVAAANVVLTLVLALAAVLAGAAAGASLLGG
ncbi:CrcB family protein [Yonghaparkia sp. Root332]|uniref:fluoride efflux transporter FluC n=1 Tax=Yonghaparkia sp. Root332 TaxID=1736516 RepID=UPI0009E78604|nr:CrcB family protein [Yonghaparkia sp. Root332]